MIELVAQPTRLEFYLRACVAIWVRHVDVDSPVAALEVFVFLPHEMSAQQRRLVTVSSVPETRIGRAKLRPRIEITAPIDAPAPVRQIGPLAAYLQTLAPFFEACSMVIGSQLRRAADMRGAESCRDWLLQMSAGLHESAKESARPDFGEWWHSQYELHSRQEIRRIQAEESLAEQRPALAEDRFWTLVTCFDGREENARSAMKALTDDELEAFEWRLQEVVSGLDSEIVRRAVRASSDDQFVYIRCALVLLGKDAVTRAIEGVVPHDLDESEWLLYVAEKEWTSRHGIAPQWQVRHLL